MEEGGARAEKGLPGTRARRRGLADAARGEARRQLRYKTGWYGSEVVEAERFFPSSKTSCACGNVQDIGWVEHWTCTGCGARHHRDDNAAINLARYRSPVGPLGPP